MQQEFLEEESVCRKCLNWQETVLTQNKQVESKTCVVKYAFKFPEDGKDCKEFEKKEYRR